MLLPTLRQLQYLKLLAEHGSFSRAAEVAHVTQPTLSAGVQELEKVLGAPVVDRARSGVILTPVGEEAVRRAQAILAQAEDLVQAARSSGRPLSGRFRLGVIPTIAPYMLPKALPALRTQFPQLRLFLREDLTGKLVSGLKAGALDAALIASPTLTHELTETVLFHEPLLAALPPNHALAGQTSVEESSLSPDLLVMADGHCLANHTLAACGAKAGLQSAMQAATLETLVNLVAAGYGTTLIPALAAPGLKNRGVELRPLTQNTTRTIRLASRPGFPRPQALRAIEKTVRRAIPPPWRQ